MASVLYKESNTNSLKLTKTLTNKNTYEYTVGQPQILQVVPPKKMYSQTFAF